MLFQFPRDEDEPPDPEEDPSALELPGMPDEEDAMATLLEEGAALELRSGADVEDIGRWLLEVSSDEEGGAEEEVSAEELKAAELLEDGVPDELLAALPGTQRPPLHTRPTSHSSSAAQGDCRESGELHADMAMNRKGRQERRIVMDMGFLGISHILVDGPQHELVVRMHAADATRQQRAPPSSCIQAAFFLLLILLIPAAARADSPSEKGVAAVFPVQAKAGVDKSAAELLTLQMVERLRQFNVFQRVLSPDEVAVLLGPVGQQTLLECATEDCALVDTELAGALGASHMLVGSLFKVGEGMLVGLKLLDLNTALEVSSLTRQLPSMDTALLLAETEPLLRALLGKAGFTLPEPAPTPPPAEVQNDGGGAPVLGGVGAGALAAAAGVLLLGGAVTSVGVAVLARMVLGLPVFSALGVPRLFPGGSSAEALAVYAGSAAAVVGLLLLLTTPAAVAAGSAALVLQRRQSE